MKIDVSIYMKVIVMDWNTIDNAILNSKPRDTLGNEVNISLFRFG